MIDVTIDGRDRLAADCARRYARASADAIASRGRFACALPGGSVAESCFPALVHANVDWSRTHVFWDDERAVPADDPQSNYALAWRLWLRHVAIPAEHIHRMPADTSDLDRAAAAYEEDLRLTLGNPPRLDLILLGVGADGHVCSLFPGHPALHERTRLVVAVTDAPKPPPHRLTLTLPALAAARSIVVCAFGSEKAAAIGGEDAARTPVALATRDHPDVAWLLDPDAAALIRRP